MDWEPEIKELYEKIVGQIPETFRPMVGPMLSEAAEKKCNERNGGSVTEPDLITGLFDITPEAFKAEAISNLQALNVDVQKYVELKDIQDEYKASLDKFGKAFHPGNVHFAMYVTDRCNQKCVHCAADSKEHRDELTTEQWKQIIDNLETSLRKEGKHGVFIWFGGEPTCREDIRELIKYCQRRG